MSDRMRCGEVFTSFDDFQKAFDEYCAANKVFFFKKATKTIEFSNKSIKNEARKYPEYWQYRSALFQCKHFGSYQTSSMGKRPIQEAFRTGCGATFRLVASKPRNGLILTKMNLEHSNHPHVLTFDAASVYPEMRRLDKDQLEELSELITLKVSSKKLIEHFKAKYNVIMTDYDIHNHRTRLKKTTNGDLTEEQFVP